jgi:hypothetical protein
MERISENFKYVWLELGYEMRSFYRVITEALGRMPRSCAPIVVGYVERARVAKKWHVKDAFEKALRRMNDETVNKSIDGANMK